MGKAIIISHAGKGQYTIDIEIDTFYLQQIKQKLEEEYTRLLFTDKANAEAAKASESVKLQNAQDAVNAAIFIYSIDRTEANRKEIDRLALEAISSSNAYRAATQTLNTVNTRLSAIRKRLDTLRSNDDTRKRTALWCTDLADGKKDRKNFQPGDEIGIIEISGQESIGQVLQPSYVSPVSDYNQTRDGFLESLHGLTPFEFLYNKTMLPGWQTWKHRYRSGVITDGNPTDGWTVQLDNTKSTEQQIPINGIANDRILTGIHAQYMSCNDLAFGLKDHVVLDVTISGPPTGTIVSATIIGFVEKPKPCLTSGFGYYALELDGTPQEWQHINDETGTWVKQPSYANDLTAAAFSNGSEPTIRSWVGDDVDSDAPVLEFIENGSAIYQSGIKLADIPTGNPWRILGAALSPKRKFLYAVFSYSSASNKVWLGRYSLAVDPALKDDGSAAEHTVILSGSLIATATMNGNISIDNDTSLTASLSAISTLNGTLSVTPGWEMQEFDLGINAIIGNIEGQFSFNASCNRAISMWGFVHGAKRTPQATPGAGASWSLAVSSYDDTWKEKLEITISAPDAQTIVKAGAALTNHGRQGALIYSYQDSTDITYEHCTQNVSISVNSSWSGSYQIESTFTDDSEMTVNLVASGSLVERTSSSDNSIDGGSVADYSLSANYGINYHIQELGVTLPYKTHVDEVISSYNVDQNPESLSTRNFVHTNGTLGINNIGALLFEYNGIERSYSGSASYHAIPPTWLSNETVRDTEIGQLYCGAPIDVSTSFTETTYIDDQPGHGVYFVGAPVNNCIDPENPPDNFHDETSYIYDLTGFNDTAWDFLVPNNPYEKVQGARAAGRKHMAYWQNTRTPGGVREYKAYLTGGDPFTLDGLTGDVIYRAIHPT